MGKSKLKVYLDTSVISALFDERNPERKQLTEDFFKIQNQFKIYISNITKTEIENTPDEDFKIKMKVSVEDFKVLPNSNEIKYLAQEYIKNNAIPEKYSEDAYHIAIAVINEMDYILSWNFKHIVKEKTRAVVNMVNTLNKYRRITIITPAELA